jgi:hypothetical protein
LNLHFFPFLKTRTFSDPHLGSGHISRLHNSSTITEPFSVEITLS